MTKHLGTLTGIFVSATVLTSRSLAKSEQKTSEVLKELNVSQEARKIEKATFEETTKRLENRVGSLEGELERSRKSYVVHSMSRFDVLISWQRYPGEHTLTGTDTSNGMPSPNQRRLLDETGTARPIR